VERNGDELFEVVENRGYVRVDCSNIVDER
jgi:hypothetical protein